MQFIIVFVADIISVLFELTLSATFRESPQLVGRTFHFSSYSALPSF
jgi:hypothetical protein